VLLNSCKNKEKPTQIVQDKKEKVEKYDNERNFKSLDKSELLKRIYDNPYFDSNEVAIWEPNYYERIALPVSFDGKCHTSIDTTMFFIDREKRKCAAIILTTYNFRKGILSDSNKVSIGDCHFCGVPIGIVLLSQDEDSTWNIYKFEKSFTWLGYFGTYRTGREDSGKISLKEIGDRWTCLSLTQGVGGNMGEFSGTENLYSIEEFQLGGFPNHILSNIFSYNFHYEYTSTDEKEKTIENSEMKIIKKKNDYYNIELVISKNGKVKTESYKYSDDYDAYIRR
jgi:hypothetical protein